MDNNNTINKHKYSRKNKNLKKIKNKRTLRNNIYNMRGGSYTLDEYKDSLNAVYYDSNGDKSGKACPITGKKLVGTGSQNGVCVSDNYCYYNSDSAFNYSEGIGLYITYEMKKLFNLYNNDKDQIRDAIDKGAILSPMTRTPYTLADIVKIVRNDINPDMIETYFDEIYEFYNNKFKPKVPSVGSNIPDEGFLDDSDIDSKKHVMIDSINEQLSSTETEEEKAAVAIIEDASISKSISNSGGGTAPIINYNIEMSILHTYKLSLPLLISIYIDTFNKYQEYIDQLKSSAIMMAETNMEYVFLDEYCEILFTPIYEFMTYILDNIRISYMLLNNNNPNTLSKIDRSLQYINTNKNSTAITELPINENDNEEYLSNTYDYWAYNTVKKEDIVRDGGGGEEKVGGYKRKNSNKQINQKGGAIKDVNLCNGSIYHLDVNNDDPIIQSSKNIKSLIDILKSNNELFHDFSELSPITKKNMTNTYSKSIDVLIDHFILTANIDAAVVGGGGSSAAAASIADASVLTINNININELTNLLQQTGEWNYSIAMMWLSSKCNKFQDITFIKYKKLDMDKILNDTSGKKLIDLIELNKQGYIYWFPPSEGTAEYRPFFYLNVDNSPVLPCMTIEQIQTYFSDNSIDVKILVPLISIIERIPYTIPNTSTIISIKYVTPTMIDELNKIMTNILYPAGVLDPSTHENGRSRNDFIITNTDNNLTKLQYLQNCNNNESFTSFDAMIDGLHTFFSMFGSNLSLNIGDYTEDIKDQLMKAEQNYILTGEQIQTPILDKTQILSFISNSDGDTGLNFQGIQVMFNNTKDESYNNDLIGEIDMSPHRLFAADTNINTITILLNLYDGIIPYFKNTDITKFITDIDKQINGRTHIRVGKTVYEINNNLKNRWVRLYSFAKRIIQGIPNTLLNKILTSINSDIAQGLNCYLSQIITALKGFGDSYEVFYVNRMKSIFNYLKIPISVRTTDKLFRDEVLGLTNTYVLSNNVGNKMPNELVEHSMFFSQPKFQEWLTNDIKITGSLFDFIPLKTTSINKDVGNCEQNTFTSITTNLPIGVSKTPIQILLETVNKILLILPTTKEDNYLNEIMTELSTDIPIIVGEQLVAAEDRDLISYVTEIYTTAINDISDTKSVGGGSASEQYKDKYDEETNTILLCIENLFYKDIISEAGNTRLITLTNDLTNEHIKLLTLYFKDLYDIIINAYNNIMQPSISSSVGGGSSEENNAINEPFISGKSPPLIEKIDLLNTTFKILYESIKKTRNSFLIKSNITINFTPLNALNNIKILFDKSDALQKILSDGCINKYNTIKNDVNIKITELVNYIQTTVTQTNDKTMPTRKSSRPVKESKIVIDAKSNKILLTESAISDDDGIVKIKNELLQLQSSRLKLDAMLSQTIENFNKLSTAYQTKKTNKSILSKIKGTLSSIVGNGSGSDINDIKLKIKQIKKDIDIIGKDINKREDALRKQIKKVTDKAKSEIDPVIITKQQSLSMFKMALDALTESSKKFISNIIILPNLNKINSVGGGVGGGVDGGGGGGGNSISSRGGGIQKKRQTIKRISKKTTRKNKHQPPNKKTRRYT